MSELHAQPLNAAELPLAGRHLIEASAGTGKTFNITRLYLRLLLEKELPVEQILVMTFTRAATAELKGRLGREIQRVHDEWDKLDDDFFARLRETMPAHKARILLQRALLCLDDAAIYTIHSFCKRALTQQAFASGISFQAELESDTSELMMEALEDWYRIEARGPDFRRLHRYYATPEAFGAAWGRIINSSDEVPEPAITDPKPAWQAFRDAWEDEADAFFQLNVKKRTTPETQQAWADIMEELDAWSREPWPGEVPDVFGGDFTKGAFSTAKKTEAMPALAALTETLADFDQSCRAWWAWKGIHYARDHLNQSKDRLDQLDFNDLIRLLRQRLQDHEGGPALARKLGAQFPAALVDEFQDTDPDQYAILRAIYQRPDADDAFLCLIGDPKQAIYGFRGGDVFAYLKARSDAQHYWVMDTNFRSCHDVIQGYNRLFFGQPLDAPEGSEVFGFGIHYTPVNTGKKDLPGLTDPADRAGFQWGLLPGEPNDKGKVQGYNKDGQNHLADWSAREIRRLLAEARLADGEADEPSERPVRPGDIAILVRDRNEAAVMQDALREQTLNAVYLSARDNVMDSPEADSLYRALNGILDLEDDRALIAALATPWFGYDTAALHHLQQDEHAWARALEEVHDLRQRWLNQGFMTMALRLLQRHAHPEPQRHERLLTNSIHLLELLQEASQKHRQPRALLHWFQQSMEEANTAGAGETQQLRLENDANLIQIVTLHGAKGLEYPVVFLPFVSYGKQPKHDKALLVRYHDRDDYSAQQVLNPGKQELTWFAEEQIAEEIRLLYVGATRAERRIYLLAADFKQFQFSPLARCFATERFDALQATLETHATEGTCGLIDLNETPVTAPEIPEDTPETQPEPAVFQGRIERDWWLSSFSALTRNARHGGLSTPDRDQDEPETPADTREQGSLRFTLPRGAEAGNLLHDLLEWLDFPNPDYDGLIRRAAERYPMLLDPFEEKQEALAKWLREILQTPLASGARLADLTSQNTLRETAFYFPMNSQQARGRLARILARHRNDADVILAEPPTLKGMLHGFVDLIYQWQGRFYVVDYKSSFLGDRLSDYREPQLTDSIRRSYYDLQYLLYSLALHRYLRTRLPDYDPKQHLGGVEYLYLRGMAPDAPGGVYHCEADIEAIEALDAFFTGEEVTP
ncbi:DNA helicase/exodeoxyribonuclease V beta subunit [Halospina denitrificans]|uniref:RecBCD enzyme subunit RecB n=1 Tax=Halospina denitrificans TaxID=332522 RepID=A0A4V3EPI5_9GAMM|nr:exodeoxyribonuclease V subunit beta [Halospina denitrificans]TDT37768.1 DNA helicase/exodeoxyribonuclease V beta subunit [Halospina denitrificans]